MQNEVEYVYAKKYSPMSHLQSQPKLIMLASQKFKEWKFGKNTLEQENGRLLILQTDLASLGKPFAQYFLNKLQHKCNTEIIF
jgi:hypothetical protein